MIKLVLMGVIVAGGLFLGIYETPNNGIAFVNSAQAQVPVPGVLALLGIGGLAMAMRKRLRK
jgi:hypothetical protein